MDYQLGVIGAGNMAEAIVRGVLAAGRMQPAQIIVADPSAARRELFQNQLQVRATSTARDFAGRCDTLLLSVKPQQMAAVLGELRESISPATLVVSIAAGVPAAFIESALGNGERRVVRTMPNTPMLVGEGVVAIAAGRRATAADLHAVRTLFESAATVVEVREDLIDAVTAVSGSGPAYFFYLVEQMIAAGEALGLPADVAATLAKRTALGAARMLTGSADSPAELRRKVTSPGGTTEAAITHMQERQMDQIIQQALAAAAARGKQLSANLK